MLEQYDVMTTSSSEIKKSFSTFDEHGFVRRGLVWCKLTTETLFSCGVQRSNYGDRYFINVGVHFLELAKVKHLPPHRCHFCGRFGSDAFQAALDFEVAAEGRGEAIHQCHRQELLPAAETCATSRGAISFLHAGALRVPCVTLEARTFLNI
jgi:hypothetical protein